MCRKCGIIMSEPTIEEVVDLVSSKFDVIEFEQGLDALGFKINQESDLKERFLDLALKLESMNLIGKIESGDDGMYVIVRRMPPKKKRRWLSSSWTPRILFAVVVSFVMIDGYYRTSGANSIINIGDPIEMAGIYTLSLLGILGVHELGHLVAARIHKLKTTWPYFIPGIPVLGFIPTFGAVIQSRGLTINREILFDVAIAGPIAGLVITIIVTVYGAYTAPVIDGVIAEQLFEDSRLIEWSQGEPLFMTGALALFGKGGESHEVLMTPVLFAAWIGFLITFLNLLPAWQLDGGHMARTLLKEKWHRYATYASMGVLVLLGYWFMAMFILILSSRNPSAQILEEVTPLTRNRKIAYVIIVILAIFCAPIPNGILS